MAMGYVARIVSVMCMGVLLSTGAVGLTSCGEAEGHGGATAQQGGASPASGGATSGGATSGGATSAEPSPTSVEEFCVAFDQAVAQQAARCLGGAADGWQRDLGISTCESFVRAESEGRIRYDAASAAQCLQKLAQGPCGYRYYDEKGPCALALAGQVGVRYACQPLDPELRWSDCVPDAYCQASSSCQGTCVEYGREGAPCGGDFVPPFCATGFACGGGVCTADAKDGERCRVFPGAPRCANTSYCQGGSETVDGICAPARSSGACTVGAGECTYGYTCPGATAGDPSSCVRFKLPGEACTQDLNECLNHCGDDGRCALAAGVGDRCGIPNNQYVYCARGLYCADPDVNFVGHCALQREVAGPCGSEVFAFRPQCPASKGHLGYCDTSVNQCAVCE